MRELYLDDRGLEMTRTGGYTTDTRDNAGAFDATGDAPAAAGGRPVGGGPPGLQGRHVCPFCGSVNDSAEGPCPRCTMENTADTRKATKSRIGPWYVLQSRNPAAPGMKFDTLLGFVNKGRVKARSIVRGPTTHQLWRFACQVKGLSREFGVCYSCGGTIARDAHVCPQCNRLQDPPANADTFIEGQTAGPSGTASVTITSTSPPAPSPVPSAAPAPIAAASPRAVAIEPPRVEAPRPPVFRELKVPPVVSGDDIVVPALGAAAAGTAPVIPESSSAAAATPAPNAPPADVVAAGAAAAAAAPPAEASLSPQPAAGTGRPGTRKATDVFLSAKDLAAAFQLDFAPERAGKSAVAEPTNSARPGERPARAVGGGMDEPLPWPPRRRRKRRVGRYVLLLLVLAVGAFAALLAIDPQFRQSAADWASARYGALTGANLYPDIAAGSARRAASQPSGPVPAAATTAPAARPPAVGATRPPAATRTAPAAPDLSPLSPAAKGQASTSPAQPTEAAESSGADDWAARLGVGPQSKSPAPSQPQRATPRPAATAPSPDALKNAETSSSTARPTSRPAAVARPAPAPPPRPKLTLQEAQQKERAWYFQAQDADAEGDYAKAAKLYKRVMDELPREIDGQQVWHSDVELRYSQAVKDMGKK